MMFAVTIGSCLTQKYFTIDERASRAEFVYFVIFAGSVLASFALMQLGHLESLANTKLFPPLISFFAVVLFIPMVTVFVRRIHDIGLSFWTYVNALIALGVAIAVSGAPVKIAALSVAIALIFVTFYPSSRSHNQYGPPP